MDSLPTVTSARAVRASSVWTEVVSPALVVQMRRLTMLTMVMEDLVPTPMLAALSKFFDLTDFNHVFSNLAGEDRLMVQGVLDRYTCAAVISPVFVLEDDGHPDHVPVSMLDIGEKMHIFRVGQDRRVISDVAEEVAAVTDRFRSQFEPGAVVSDGDRLSPEAIVLGVDRSVEYVGG